MHSHFGHFITPILNAVREYPHVGQFLTFIIAFIESLPILGTIFPGSIAMTAIGTLVGASYLPGLTTLAYASLGAFLGDCFGFWFGKHYKDQIKSAWPFKKYTNWLNMAENFFKKHGGKSILIGRFFGPVRSTVPLIAGVLDLSWPRFIVAAVPSAILWAILYMLPGILLGALALELPPSKMTEFILIGLAVICLAWFLVWLIEKFFRHLVRLCNAALDNFWDWLKRHHTSSFFVQYIQNRQNPADHQQLTLSILGLLCFGVFVFLACSVKMHATWVSNLNNPIFYLIQSLRTATFDTFFVLVSLFFSPSIMIFLGIILGMLLLLKNRRRDAAHLLGALAITVLLLGFFRWWLYSPRPLGFMILKESSSFPSGHTLLSLIVLSLGTYFLNQNTVSVQWRWLTRCCAGILILFVAVSRIYLGQHWLTDLLAAFFLGSSILLFTLVNYRRMPKIQAQANFPWYTWALALCLAWLIPGTVDAGLHYKKLHYATTPYSVEFHINMEQWWQSPFEYLPLFRNNRFGHPMLPFNLQWAQPLPAIKTLLEKAGWKEINHKKPTVTSTIRRLASSDPEFHMPIFQWLYLNQPPALVMIRRLSNSKAIMELRLWQTNVHFLDSDVPLWIGTVNLHYPPHRILGIDTEKQTIVFAPPEVTAALQGDLQGAQVKIIQTDEQQLPPEKLKSNHWNRQVILVR